MKQKAKKLLSVLLTLVMVLGLAPAMSVPAQAADSGTSKAIQLGTGGITGYDSANGYDYIYFGHWTAPDENTTSGPLKWRVLDTKTNTGGKGLFLLSDALLGTGLLGEIQFQQDPSHWYSDNNGRGEHHKGGDPADGDHSKCRILNAWQGSDAQGWCSDFYAANLSTQEQKAILATTKDDGAYSSARQVAFAASEKILNGDKVFFLSSEEAEKAAYGFTDDSARTESYGDKMGLWWLRSPYANGTNIAGIINNTGYVGYFNVSSARTARPALNLDLSKVLFTSSPDGKEDGENGLAKVDDYDGSEWKLTLKDENRQFKVTDKSPVSGEPGDKLSFAYTDATVKTDEAPNEWISAILADEDGNALYYGRLTQPESADSGENPVEVKIPVGLAEGTYTLKLFSEQYNSEQYNGDCKTDYASAFSDVALTVEADSDAVQVKKGGDDSTFAADAPIATVRLDPEKFNMNNVNPTWIATRYEFIDGVVWTKSLELNQTDDKSTDLPDFRLTFSKAAILPDGTEKDVEVVFENVTVIGQQNQTGYFDTVSVARIPREPNQPIAFSPLSTAQKHIGLRADITFRVNGADDGDVFFFDARHINVNRTGNSNFMQIAGADANFNYSESMAPISGVVPGSHLYLPQGSVLQVVEHLSTEGYGYRFVGIGSEDPDSFNHGFAAAAQAENGFRSRVWSSAGTNPTPVEIFFLGGGLSHALSVSSGSGGTAELWSDGTVDSTAAKNLPGGTLVKPLTYDVPNGKQVTVKMTPQSGNELDTLYVNGNATEADAVTDSTGKVTHYTYTFPADATEDQSLEVIWETEASVWWKYDSETLYISGEEKEEYTHFHEDRQAKVGNGESIPWRDHQEKIEFAVIEGNPAPVSTHLWFSNMSSLKEIRNIADLDTSNVTNMGGMFLGSSLPAVDVSGFNTSNVTDMSNMFNGCASLTALDVSGFDMSKVSNVKMMFDGCASLETIYAAPGTDWWRDQEEGRSASWSIHHDAMFNGCTSLVGGSGTDYDTFRDSARGARVDGGATDPGYFTATKAVRLGGSGIKQHDTVYLGTYQNTTPVPWIALDNSGFMLSKYTIGTSTFRENYGYYDGSVLQGTMNGLYNGEVTTLFQSLEQGAIKETTLDGASMYNGQSDVSAHLFPLSFAEAEDVGWENDLLKARSINDPEGFAGLWWLRSSDNSGNAYWVYADGSCGNSVIYGGLGVRPALNLDLSKILFTSAAEGGKEAGASGLAPVEPYAGREWKLTLKDTANHRDFQAVVTAVEDEKLTVTWNFAKTGTNEYLSAVIKDNASGALTHYGRLAELKDESASRGTWEIDLSGIDMTDKTLYVFNEQYNGGDNDDTKLTDYASKLIELPADAPNAYPVELSVHGFSVLHYWNFVRPDSEATRVYLKPNPGYYYDTNYHTLQVEIGDKGYYGNEALRRRIAYPNELVVEVKDPAKQGAGFSGKVKITYTAEPIPYEITYELDGGTNHPDNPATYTVESGAITLKDPEKRGHTFGGWYDNAEFNGSPVTEIPANSTGEKTFYAKWTRNSSGGGIVTPSYPVTLQQPGEGGTVSTDPANAKPGAKVTVTPQPEEGYEVDTVKVTDKDGKEIPVTKNDDGTFSFTMPSGKVTVTATFKEKTGHDCPSAKFTDVKESDWFHEYVDYVVSKGLMNGVSADKFGPGMTTTRAMIVTILYRLEGEPEVSGPSPFFDVPADGGQWYTNAILWAGRNGIVEGYIEGPHKVFGPDKPITREQFASILYRYVQMKGGGFTGAWYFPLDFADAADVSDWADEAMHWCVMNGIFEGDENGKLRPQGEATRAEVAAILTRFLENVK